MFSGLVLSCPALIKNTLCQDKQWPRIWWIFLSRDNEVQLTPIKLNWASATGLFQRWLRRAGWKPKPTLFAKEGEIFLKKSPERCRNALSSWEWSRGVSSNSQVYELSWSFRSLLDPTHPSASSTEPTIVDADISHWATWVLTEEVWHLQIIWKSVRIGQVDWLPAIFFFSFFLPSLIWKLLPLLLISI